MTFANINRVYLCGSVLEQAVGEAAGRGANIEAARSVNVDAAACERVVELIAAAADETRWLCHIERRIRGDRGCGPQRDVAVHTHLAREDQRLCL